MAPSAAARRRKRLGGRIIRSVLAFALIVGFAYLIHRPLVHVFHGARIRIQTAGEGPTRMSSGSATPTTSDWLGDLQLQQLGAARACLWRTARACARAPLAAPLLISCLAGLYPHSIPSHVGTGQYPKQPAQSRPATRMPLTRCCCLGCRAGSTHADAE